VNRAAEGVGRDESDPFIKLVQDRLSLTEREAPRDVRRSGDQDRPDERQLGRGWQEIKDLVDDGKGAIIREKTAGEFRQLGVKVDPGSGRGGAQRNAKYVVRLAVNVNEADW
jgi:hypothetical protein